MANYPKIKSASTVIAFDNPVSVLPDLTITGPVTFTKSTSSQQPTWSTKITIIADGVNAPNFDAFDTIGVGGYDNTNGVKNICIFTYWGDSLYTVCITPVTISSGSGDTTAPTLTSGNATDSTHVTLVFSENVTPTVTGWSLYDATTLTTYSFGSVSGSGNTWTFVLASGTLTAGNTLSVSYNATTGNTLDTAGNELATLSNFSITNGVGGGTTLNAPTGVTLGTATDVTQPLTWTDTNSSPNENGYKVYYNTVNTFGSATLATTTAANATSYTVTGLTASTLYYYWVVAQGNGTTTADSSPSTVQSGSTAAGSSTSYANTGGTGDRSAVITVTSFSSAPLVASGSIANLVNGNLTETSTWFNNIDISADPAWIQFDFGSGASKIIDEAKWYQSGSQTQGTWKWQGSNDGSSWTDIGSSFTLGGATTQTISALAGNTTGYRYYRMLGVSGTPSPSPYIFEIEFKISA